MRILVCVKRVPAPGAQITLTADGRAIDTRNLGFTTSPHEECAVEEAIRLVEAHGGDITVLTVGPPEAEEQLRFSISVGAQHAVLVTNDAIASGEDPDPQATARAIAEAVRALEADAGPFDVLLFGNESADSGGFQVGMRVARRSVARSSTASRRSRSPTACSPRAASATPASRSTGSRCPAVVGVKEGINLRATRRCRDGCARRRPRSQTIAADPPGGGLTMVRFETPAVELTETVLLGTGRRCRGRRRRPALRAGAGVTNPVLVLIDHDRGTVGDEARQAIAFARSLSDAAVAAVVIGGDAPPAVAGADAIWHVRHAELDDYAPEAWGDALHQLAVEVKASAIVATGTERGNEVLAHVAAIADEPFAANVVTATPGFALADPAGAVGRQPPRGRDPDRAAPDPELRAARVSE